jgi:hypothetical protein
MNDERFKANAVLIVLVFSGSLALWKEEFIPIWSAMASTVIGGYFGAMLPQTKK